jgi:hypothetical protein
MGKRLSVIFITIALLAITRVAAQDVPVESSESQPVWFRLESACTDPITLNGAYTGPSNLLGYVLYDPNTAENRIYARKMLGGDNELWALIRSGTLLRFKNKGTGRYMTGSYSLNSSGEQVNYGSYGQGQYWISSGGNSPVAIWNNLRCDRLNNGRINSNTAFFIKMAEDTSNKEPRITGISVKNGQVTTGRGNKDFASIYFSVNIDGSKSIPLLESVKLDLTGTTHAGDVSNIRIYKTGSDTRFRPGVHKLVAAGIDSSGYILIRPDSAFHLTTGTNNFAVVVDVSEEAGEGNLIRTRVISAKLSDSEEFQAEVSAPPFPATIFMTQSTLFSPGDLGSKFYRIPAIVTAKDGSLVTATDKRNNHEGDLPANIDMYIRRSTDNGKTWSEPLMIAGADTEVGFGDAALVVEKETGKIFCMMASDKGFFGSTPSSPIRIVVSESSDNGITWSVPLDITSSLYGSECTDPVSMFWNGMFIASGRGLQLRNGRLMFVVAVRGVTSGIDNYVIYSDDKGKTWNINTNMVHKGGDEAKLAQRNSGDVVISIRNAVKREWNTSRDNGISWESSTLHPDLTDPNCNGEIMTYTSTLDGFEKNRMLHSLAYASNRSNVSMLLSYDEGKSFPVVKTVCPAPSAYSTFTILPDGTIGMYYEDGTIGGGFDMVFVRFSLSWLTNGADKYQNSVTGFHPEIFNRNNISVAVRDRKIYLTGQGDQLFSVYNLSGAEIDPGYPLTPGIYIVKVGSDTLKIAVI